MKVKVQEIDIIALTRREALELKCEITKATDGGLCFATKEYPRLYELFRLIDANFDSEKSGVHVIRKDE